MTIYQRKLGHDRGGGGTPLPSFGGITAYCQSQCAVYKAAITLQAPEIMLGQPYDTKVDLWSVGVILYGKC